MSLTKLRLGRNNSVMTSLFPPRESLVVTSGWGRETREPIFYGVVYFSAINSIAGDVTPLSCFKKNWINIFEGSIDSEWCLPAIESIAGVHIVEFYWSRDVFSRYHIYHVKDFTCILPTHQKSPAHSSVFRGFFAKCVWQIFKAGCTTTTQFIILTYPFV